MLNTQRHIVILTGLCGLLAAILVGTGEFLLHYDALSRYSETDYNFMLAGSNGRQSMGHYFAVLSAPLYIIGCWHIYLMLRPANQKLAMVGFIVGAYGFMIGADWISSRSSIGAITHLQQSGVELQSLVELYRFRYENLLSIIRVTTLVLSLIIIYLSLTGKSHYSKWIALFNPIVLLVMNFVIYALAPEIGKYLMPIALNIGFGLFFILSLYQARNISQVQ